MNSIELNKIKNSTYFRECIFKPYVNNCERIFYRYTHLKNNISSVQSILSPLFLMFGFICLKCVLLTVGQPYKFLQSPRSPPSQSLDQESTKILRDLNENPSYWVKSPSFLLLIQQALFQEKQADSGRGGF